ncbi:hypothetical protein QBC46DRAFT_410021 [Diplogelasinospora grovesii]|uniref:Copper-fist domain-containing protein n=1 Tax=Diplogelasinospora grovesii TaxID=303347 RepID=A0AAN6N536_9PEZI|nr:hypothetical protein QBC46DRAFT_410021 [Diplogelasinospora grovesii]
MHALHIRGSARTGSGFLALSSNRDPSACHPRIPFGRSPRNSQQSTPKLTRAMPSCVINGVETKLACGPCIRGHRASKCQHTDRVLQNIRNPGRPLTTCPHPPGTLCACTRLTLQGTDLEFDIADNQQPPKNSPQQSLPQPGVSGTEGMFGNNTALSRQPSVIEVDDPGVDVIGGEGEIYRMEGSYPRSFTPDRTNTRTTSGPRSRTKGAQQHDPGRKVTKKRRHERESSRQRSLPPAAALVAQAEQSQQFAYTTQTPQYSYVSDYHSSASFQGLSRTDAGIDSPTTFPQLLPRHGAASNATAATGMWT